MGLTDRKVREVVNGLEIPGFKVEMADNFGINGQAFSVAKLNVMNSYRRNADGSWTTPSGGDGTLRNLCTPPYGSQWIDEAQIIEVVFTYCQFFNDHELREFFFYRGQRPYDPHSPQQRTTDANNHFVNLRNATFQRPDVPWAHNEYTMRYADKDDLTRIEALTIDRSAFVKAVDSERIRIRTGKFLRGTES